MAESLKKEDEVMKATEKEEEKQKTEPEDIKEGLNQSDASDNDNEDDDDDDDDEDGTVVEPLATRRSRRSNAGAKMSQIISAEEDEFYSNTYGGFNEEDDDRDFDEDDDLDDEEIEDDYSVDSDFSIDETDEIAPEFQDESEETKKKSHRVYKEPKQRTKTNSETASTSVSTSDAASGPAPTRAPKTVKPLGDTSIKSRFVRESTKEKSEQTLKRMQTKTRRRKRPNNYQSLTQEEILAESKSTEEENLLSLERYQKLELEKLKKIKTVKKTVPKPYITYTSTTMPVIGTKERYTRNFLTFIT